MVISVQLSGRNTEMAADRVKTDARDTLSLARLSKLGEITAVSIPSADQEAARALVRRRGSISKLLLPPGTVYSNGQSLTGTHERCLAYQHYEVRPGN